ncbi:hypothetical protein D3872_07745 [Massilia cavernae]|uniref:Transposase IS4-like domain-containing protein n=1 Tax=Massilia cavernae TaxID=2320864 RepID=A0A418Y4M9_9BURK|nr:hypothetical protein D3872_07745 [Massilia cavernae]
MHVLNLTAFVLHLMASRRERLARRRWVVERPLGWLHRFRRLRIRCERRTDIDQPFLSLACLLICWRYVERSC